MQPTNIQNLSTFVLYNRKQPVAFSWIRLKRSKIGPRFQVEVNKVLPNPLLSENLHGTTFVSPWVEGSLSTTLLLWLGLICHLFLLVFSFHSTFFLFLYMLSFTQKQKNKLYYILCNIASTTNILCITKSKNGSWIHLTTFLLPFFSMFYRNNKHGYFFFLVN